MALLREFGPLYYDANYYGHDGPSQKSNYNLPYNELRFRRVARFRLTAAHVLNELKLKKNGEMVRILDIGGATGLLARYLNHVPGVESYNLDLSTWATQNSLPDMRKRSIQGDARVLPFGTNAFDGIVCLDVLEHIPGQDTDHVLKEMYRVMKHGARGVLGIVLQEGTETDKDLSHITRMNQGWWAERILEAGFSLDNSLSVKLARIASRTALGGKILSIKPGLFVVTKT